MINLIKYQQNNCEPVKMYQRIIDFLAKILGIKRKSKGKKKPSSDDIYPLW